jgi:hypothetical protein
VVGTGALFLVEHLKTLLQCTDDVIHIHSGALGNVVCKYYPVVIKEGKNHLLLQLAKTLALMGLGMPPLSHFLDRSLVSGVCVSTQLTYP